jgi:hypothetical protein
MRRVHLVVEPVEPLPLLGGDFFAHLAGILARALTQVVTEADWLSKTSERVMASDRRPLHARGIAERGSSRCQRVSALVSEESSIRLMVTSSWRTVFSARSR